MELFYRFFSAESTLGSGWRLHWDAVDWYHDDAEELLLEMCSCYGINQEDIKLLLEFGYHYDEIEQMLMNTAQLTEALLEIKAVLSIE